MEDVENPKRKLNDNPEAPASKKTKAEEVEIKDAGNGVTREWLTNLPKIELHAHISGSIRESTIVELLEEEKENSEGDNAGKSQTYDFKKGDRTLSQCFELFDIIHRVVNTDKIIQRITEETIEDFNSENVKYLELRTTPRKIPGCNLTKRGYVQSVIDIIKKCEKRNDLDIVVKLLLSVNRCKSKEDAFDTITIALEYPEYVVGIDFSGNPNVNEFGDFVEAFQKAKDVGLKLSIHTAEIFNEKETTQILQFGVDRLGHACCLENDNYNYVTKHRIPIEICATSNVKTEAVPDYKSHKFGELLAMSHPLSICTDDRGVFNISLTDEYCQLFRAFDLNQKDFEKLTVSSVDLIFADESTKQKLRQRFLDLISSSQIS